MNVYKKLFSVKYENILAILYIPYMIINLGKASNEMFLIAIAMHLLLSLVLFYSIRTTRKEALEEIRHGIYEPIFDLEEISDYIKEFIITLNKMKKCIIKEVKTQKYTNRQTYILKKSI